MLIFFVLHIKPAICLEAKGLDLVREFQDIYSQIANCMCASLQSVKFFIAHSIHLSVFSGTNFYVSVPRFSSFTELNRSTL